MSKQDELLAKAKKKSPVSAATPFVPEVVEDSELDVITRRIKGNVDQFERLRDKAKDLKKRIADDILYVTQNKSRLLPHRSLQDYITNDLQISKEYFYQIKRGYDFLLEHNKEDLIEEADFRIIDDIARIKNKKVQEKLLSNIQNVTRSTIKEELQKADPDYSNDSINPAKVDLKNISSIMKVLESVMVTDPEQISKARNTAFKYLVGGNQNGILWRFRFSKKQLETIRNHIDAMMSIVKD